jgi:membrane-bound metal-dependent hydrolase YbcI (DUF457 family)
VATCVGAAALVLGVALAASLVAAHRASHTDFLVALRHEQVRTSERNPSPATPSRVLICLSSLSMVGCQSELRRLSMEIVSHALWATAAAQAANGKVATRVRVAWFAGWAAFPDLLAFTPAVIAGLWYRLSGAARIRAHHSGVRRSWLDFDLYEVTHSLVVFALVFAVVWLIFRRPVWELLGWALHVLMDIPTHSSRFPTPFLWPLSSYRIIGISWRQGWFMALDVSALMVVFLLLWRSRRRVRQEGESR